MSFSNEWEKLFASGSHFSQYPWSDLISLVIRYANPKNYVYKPKVLELGPGVGANIPFFLDKGFEYYAVEGSTTAVEYIKKKFGSNVKIVAGDFTTFIPYDDKFDLIVDRGAITCNSVSGIKNALTKSKSALKSDGLYIGIDWYSVKHPCINFGVEVENNTRRDINKGTLSGTGTVHFFSETEIKELLDDLFTILHLEHKSYDVIIPNGDLSWASFNLVAKVKA